MKTIQFFADTNRSGNLLHIETDGCIVNIHVGLTDDEGRKVTAVRILPEDESRSPDIDGHYWHLEDGCRVVRQHKPKRYLARISEPEPRSLSDGDRTMEFTNASDAWNWLYEERREQLDAAGIGGDDEDPYDGDECLRDINAKATVSFTVREGWDASDKIDGNTPGWNADDGPDPGLSYAVEVLD